MPTRASCATRTARCWWCRTPDGARPGRAARDPHLVGPAQGRPGVQAQEAAPAPVPRLRLARAPASPVPRGGAAEPPARARRLSRRAGARPATAAACGSRRRTRPAPSSTRSRCGATTRTPPSRAGSTPARPGSDEVAAVGRRIAAFHAGAARPADPERAVAAFEAMLSENFATLRELHADPPLIDDAERLATAVLAGRRDELLRRARTRPRARRPRGPARRARRARARDRDRRLRRVRPGPAGDRRRPRPRLPRHGPAAARRAARRRARLGLPRGRRRSRRRRARRLLRRPAGAHPGEGRARAGGPGRRAPTLRAAGRTPSRCSRSRSGSGGACGSGRQWSSPGRPPAASRRSRRRSASGLGRACCRPISSARSSWVSRRRLGRPRAPTSRPSTAGPTRRSGGGHATLIDAGERVVVDATFRFRADREAFLAALGARPS